jgi:hypothetical protein
MVQVPFLLFHFACGLGWIDIPASFDGLRASWSYVVAAYGLVPAILNQVGRPGRRAVPSGGR